MVEKLNIRRPHSSGKINTGFLCYQSSSGSPDCCLFLSFYVTYHITFYLIPFPSLRRLKYVQNPDSVSVRVTVKSPQN